MSVTHVQQCIYLVLSKLQEHIVVLYFLFQKILPSMCLTFANGMIFSAGFYICTNVILVKNHSLNQGIWRIISRQFMKGKEITNVILVENPSLNQDLWRRTTRHFMKDIELTNVILVGNPSLNQEIWRHTSKLLMNHEPMTHHLKAHLKQIHDGLKKTNYHHKRHYFFKSLK